MATILTLDKCCDLALKEIGVVGIADTAATEEELKRAREQADLMLPHFMAGIMRSTPMIEQQLSFDLTGGEQDYELIDELDVSAIAVVLNVALRDSSGRTTPLKVVDLDTWANITDKAASGIPRLVYIEPSDTPTLQTYPTLGDDQDDYELVLDVLTYNSAFILTTEQRVGLPQKFQLWFVLQLAARCGGGPVRRIERQRLNDLKNDAKECWEDLTAYGNQIRTVGDDCVDPDPYQTGDYPRFSTRRIGGY